MKRTDRSLGQIAFDAYGDNRKWRDWKGNLMPPWTGIAQEIRDAWEVAAQAVEGMLKLHAVEDTHDTQD